MVTRNNILRVAINTPVRKLFDYLLPEKGSEVKLQPGMRLQVPFGRSREKIGLLIAVTDSSTIERHRLKRATMILDNYPVLPRQQLELMLWAAEYYQHPVGEVILGHLPKLLSQGAPAELPRNRCWKACYPVLPDMEQQLTRAPRQKALLLRIRQFPDGICQDNLREDFAGLQSLLKGLEDKGLVESFNKGPQANATINPVNSISLNDEQIAAVATITDSADRYKAFLLDGVTSSGKTEVYIHAIREIIANGKQALVLVPEIGLTPQFICRLRDQLGTDIAVIHSGLSDRERFSAWLMARDGLAPVVVGTRSAIWTPLAKPGIIIVDEEHDLSYKQQEGFRYSARDLAVTRARRDNIPVVLGSATPSMESVYNARKQRYHEIRLTRRAGSADLPDIHVLDIRGSKMDGALSSTLLQTIHEYLQRRQQILLFLNRRGYAPLIMCHDCGWISKCPRCDKQMTYHKHSNRLWCHHCEHQEKRMTACGQCNGGNLLEIGHGTQRVLETLEKNFPDAATARLDRDSTRRKGSMESILAQVEKGEIDILVGTQMMAKGHHFPGVTLVGIIDADHGLFSNDFRGSERMAQLILQVSGRAGRSDNRGVVLIQSHYPGHPLLKTLCQHDYSSIAGLILAERENALLPPLAYQILLRAEANDKQSVGKFLDHAREALPKTATRVEAFGPFPSPIELKAGRYRMQLLLQSGTRKSLRECIDSWVQSLEKLPGSRKVRWSLDVDPQDML
ncbi:MAG TPA: primosomal protein N' [Gammaproteobacteria bacterium]|nr:primosomal protein N' [Gammaproteobacteria bacterium]